MVEWQTAVRLWLDGGSVQEGEVFAQCPGDKLDERLGGFAVELFSTYHFLLQGCPEDPNGGVEFRQLLVADDRQGREIDENRLTGPG